MARCETCGNEYDKAFTLILKDESHTFDCFECAIFALAPECAQCGVRIIGHGVETGEQMFCCANCAHVAGVRELQDRV
ncbi:MAG: hypothetical protein ACOZIN_06225 [Myxococcota bacterium]